MKANVSSIIRIAARQFLKVTDLIDTRVKYTKTCQVCPMLF